MDIRSPKAVTGSYLDIITNAVPQEDYIGCMCRLHRPCSFTLCFKSVYKYIFLRQVREVRKMYFEVFKISRRFQLPITKVHYHLP